MLVIVAHQVASARPGTAERPAPAVDPLYSVTAALAASMPTGSSTSTMSMRVLSPADVTYTSLMKRLGPGARGGLGPGVARARGG